MLDPRQINTIKAKPQSIDARDKLALIMEVERLRELIRKIEYASRKDSLTKEERLDEVRGLVLAELT